MHDIQASTLPNWGQAMNKKLFQPKKEKIKEQNSDQLSSGVWNPFLSHK